MEIEPADGDKLAEWGTVIKSSTPWQGTIDDVRIYNRALSPAEVQQLYTWAPGPVAHWKIDDGSGQVVTDSSVNGTNGILGQDSATAADDPTWSIGKYGKGLTFDGSADYVNIPTSSSLSFGTGSFSVQWWAKYPLTQSAAHAGIIVDQDWRSNATNTNWWGISQNSTTTNSIRYHEEATGDGSFDTMVTVDTGITDGWHYFALIRDTENDKLKLYRDGQAVYDNSYTADVNLTNHGLFLGKNNNGYAGGSIDDVRLYNYARTPGQITEDMNAGHPPPAGGPGLPSSAIAHFNFDEGYGDTTFDLGTGRHNGNISAGNTCPGYAGCPTWVDGKFGKALNISLQGGLVPYVDFGDVNDYDTVFTGSYTISIWTKTTSTNIINRMIGKGLGTMLVIFNYPTAGKVKFYTGSGVDANALDSVASNLNDGAWHHLVFIRNNTTQKIYIDGQFDNSRAEVSPPGVSASSFRIGHDGSGSNYTFEGALDEVKIFNSALTADQVKLLYNQSSSVVMGSTGTTAAGVTDFSSSREYCPPGNTEGNCAAGQNPAPVGEWKLDEKTGTAANDTSGNNNNGSLTGLYWAKGKIGGGLQKKTTQSHKVSVTSETGLSPTGTYTLEGWFYWNGIGDDWLISKQTTTVDDVNKGYLLRALTPENALGCIRGVGASNQALYTANDVLTPNKWYHVACVFDGTNLRLYLNGSYYNASASNATPTDYTSTSTFTLLGHNTSSRTFDGIADDVRVYPYARTPAQIAWDFNRGAPIAQYDFDECTGTVLHDTAPKADPGMTPLNGTITPGASGNTAAGTCNSGISTEMWNDGTSGKYSASLGFDGTNDYVRITENGSLMPTSQISISAWVKTTSNQCWAKIACKPYATSGWSNPYVSWCLSSSYDCTGRPYLDITTGGSKSVHQASTVLQNGVWYHIVGTYDGSSMKIYVNGKQEGSAAKTGSIDYNGVSTDVNIGSRGSYSNGEYQNGLIDDLKIYNYTLSPVQVKTLYNEGSSVRFGP